MLEAFICLIVADGNCKEPSKPDEERCQGEAHEIKVVDQRPRCLAKEAGDQRARSHWKDDTQYTRYHHDGELPRVASYR